MAFVDFICLLNWYAFYKNNQTSQLIFEKNFEAAIFIAAKEIKWSGWKLTLRSRLGAGNLLIHKQSAQSFFMMNERKRPIHLPPLGFAGDSVIVFVTICSKGRSPVLANDTLHQTLKDAWADGTRWLVGRYVILPDHIHLFCSPSRDCSTPLERWVGFWKNNVARKIKPQINTLLWQREFWDRQLRSGENYNQKWDYVRNNPVRHGYCAKAEDWPYQGEIHDLRW